MSITEIEQVVELWEKLDDDDRMSVILQLIARANIVRDDEMILRMMDMQIQISEEK